MISIKSGQYRIRVYLHENGNSPFEEWIKKLDGAVRARINARLARFENGHFGDHKFVGDGVIEARFFFGSGYRVYFTIYEDQIVLLLTGGDKSSQGDDINKAKLFLKFYLEEQNANKKS